MYCPLFQSDNRGNTGRGNFYLVIGTIQSAVNPMIFAEAGMRQGRRVSLSMLEIGLTSPFIILLGELRWKLRLLFDRRSDFADSEYERNGCEHAVRIDVSAAAI